MQVTAKMQGTLVLKYFSSNAYLTIITVILTLIVLALSYMAGDWKMAVYALSFWQYLVYALAFFWLRISLDAFKFDSMVLKTISLAALAWVFWITVPSPLSLAVIAAGFALNLSAVLALGADRTYYGVELGAITADRVNTFPYSTIPHPMLLGNIFAYGGMLLDAQIRQDWWPLILGHVVLNALIIFMEAYGDKNDRHGVIWPWTVVIIGSLLFLVSFMDVWQLALPIVITGIAFAALIFQRYTAVSAKRSASS